MWSIVHDIRTAPLSSSSSRRAWASSSLSVSALRPSTGEAMVGVFVGTELLAGNDSAAEVICI